MPEDAEICVVVIVLFVVCEVTHSLFIKKQKTVNSFLSLENNNNKHTQEQQHIL
jgi:hypothetical protein